MAVRPEPFRFQPFVVSVLPDRERVVVALEGELDLSGIDALDVQVRELRRAGFDQLVLDLRRLQFIDSAGLRTLLSFRNDAKRDGHHLTLRAGPPGVQRVFEVTGTRGLFDWLA
jgi:anti-sigma B factor antagonist